MDFDPRDCDDARDDERWGYGRDLGERGAGDARDRDDPRDPFVDGLDLPRTGTGSGSGLRRPTVMPFARRVHVAHVM